MKHYFVGGCNVQGGWIQQHEYNVEIATQIFILYFFFFFRFDLRDKNPNAQSIFALTFYMHQLPCRIHFCCAIFFFFMLQYMLLVCHLVKGTRFNHSLWEFVWPLCITAETHGSSVGPAGKSNVYCSACGWLIIHCYYSMSIQGTKHQCHFVTSLHQCQSNIVLLHFLWNLTINSTSMWTFSKFLVIAINSLKWTFCLGSWGSKTCWSTPLTCLGFSICGVSNRFSKQQKTKPV